MNKKIIAILLLSITILMAGCQPTPNGGDIVYSEREVSWLQYYRYKAIENELNKDVIIGEPIINDAVYTIKIDETYIEGVKYRNMSMEEYEALQSYQNETGIQIIYPNVRFNDRPTLAKNQYDGNIYYLTENPSANIPRPKLDKNGNFILNYWKYEEETKSSLIAEYNSLRIEGDDGFTEDGKTYFYAYGRLIDGGIEVRVVCYEYNKFLAQYSETDAE